VVTNKRLPPTRLIVEHLGWQGYFTGLYSLDAFDPKLKSKAEVLDRVIAIHSIPKEEALYVGDRFEDLEAATVAGLGFVGVCWGYGTLDSKHVRVLQNPIDLNSLFDFGY
jgi:phosphoglycolate phosphatase